jgi:hypothetical protein
MDNLLQLEEISFDSSVRYEIYAISWEGLPHYFKEASEDEMVQVLKEYLNPTNFHPMIFM